MKKASRSKAVDDLRPEYDLAEMRGTVRGKYHRRAVGNWVQIAPELLPAFPDAAAVNRALRLLLRTARAVASPDRAPRR
jgi:hypothetical protein